VVTYIFELSQEITSPLGVVVNNVDPWT